MESLDRVEAFVHEHFKNKNMHRYKHITGVVQMAQRLAQVYDVDETKAMIAAYMHDYCKYDSKDYVQKLLTKEEIDECDKFPFLYHAYASAYVYKNHFGEDVDVFNAIYNHVFGRPNMSILEKIIMISDYTEIGREHDSCIACRKILLEDGIDAAILYSLEKTIDFVKQNGEEPHPRQMMVYKEYLEKVGK